MQYDNYLESASFCFINPFANHSYFTVRALSSVASVYLFCPPLQIQLFFRAWDTNDLALSTVPLKSRLASFSAICAFLLFRLRLIGHSCYLSLFRFFLIRYLHHTGIHLGFVFYQDYVANLLAMHYPGSLRICELIIASDESQPNYLSTISAIQNSSAIVLPTPSLLNLCHDLLHTPIIAPYGGNKIVYQSKPEPLTQSLATPPPKHKYPGILSQTIRIVARAHNYRKGADVFLQSLEILNTMLVSASSPVFLDILICGSIVEPNIKSEYKRVQHLLKADRKIHVISKQYQSDSYASLLSSADLFVMPSRLESTSLAALEALWFGVPSILSSQCGVDPFVEDRHGLQLVQHHPAILAQAIYTLSTSIKLREHCRACLAEDRHLFSWSEYFLSYKNLLSSKFSSC